MKKPLYVNIDPDTLGYIFNGSHGDLSDFERKIDLYIEGYKGHGIEHLPFSIFCQNSLVPTDKVEFIADKFEKKTEDGTPVNYSNETHTLAMREAVRIMPDPIGFIMERIRAAGFKLWISYRMNDCHGSHEPTFCGRSENLYYKAKHEGGFIGDHVAGRYYGECLDYSKDFVRETMLAFIRDTALKYESYGLELDFLREIFCFDYEKTPNCREIMTGFMREVKKIALEAEKKWGHPMKILVRLVRDIKNNYIFGFDVAQWIKEGLVDVISPCSRWDDTDSDMPIAEWKKLTEGTSVEIVAGLEFYLKGRINISEECANALTAQYLDDGSDGMYLYNYYRESVPLPDMTEWYKKHPDFVLFDRKVEDKRRADGFVFWDFEKFLKLDRNKAAIWEACANGDVARESVRRHVMTYTEPPLVPKGGNSFFPFPAVVSGTLTLEKLTGEVENRRTVLYLGVNKNDTPPEVTLDDSPATLLGKTEDAYYQNPAKECDLTGYENTDFYAYAITPKSGTRRKITLAAENTTVNYLEIKVN